jgi:hypothetical protein
MFAFRAPQWLLYLMYPFLKKHWDDLDRRSEVTGVARSSTVIFRFFGREYSIERSSQRERIT